MVPGANPHTAGGRKPTSVSYSSRSVKFGDADPVRGGCLTGVSPARCKGGVFWDGRATGTTIGLEVFAGDSVLQTAYEPFLGPMADQALGPFANDVEQNVPDGNDNGLPGAEAVCLHVKRSKYAVLYRKAWGTPIECAARPDLAFKRIAVAISAWEHSPDVDSYSSKLDRALARDRDDTPGQFPLAGFSAQENRGRDLFFGVTSELNPAGKNAKCARCHNSEGTGADGNQPFQTFSDNSFHHLGVPPNYQISNFDADKPDYGLAHHLMPANPQREYGGRRLQNADSAQRGQTSAQTFRQGVHAQRLLQVAGGSRALLQHRARQAGSRRVPAGHTLLAGDGARLLAPGRGEQWPAVFGDDARPVR